RERWTRLGTDITVRHWNRCGVDEACGYLQKLGAPGMAAIKGCGDRAVDQRRRVRKRRVHGALWTETDDNKSEGDVVGVFWIDCNRWLAVDREAKGVPAHIYL